ncbi:PD-(D/E)XK nuclease family protein [Treponema pectinovorum]|uniref:PD-(D/E)XK nuclease family protein n=1 Tax=Treponema pectinovorum TaxID=164 RepID=UPI0011CA3612|nr:PD-(D/E)XK nuclease family protein [Treponema pectinovorum]
MQENLIEKNLRENIRDENCIFVFPTEISASMWADRIIFTSDCSAVSMERFLAWDKFKAQAVRGENQGKESIPATMRSIFASLVIQENAKNPFFKNLIPQEFAKTASSFTNWLASILPSLGLWKEFSEKNGGAKDLEDFDLEELYKRYKAFLDKYNLFDPAWERPPFKNNGKKYVIFFPEINSDWEEYRSILENSTEFIKIVRVSDEEKILGGVKVFNNSRVEIKNLASEISILNRKKGVPWSQIAVSVPDLELFGPYIDREFELMEIPHVMRFSRALDATGAGCLFRQIKECAESQNAYESIKNFLLNNELPWKTGDLGEKLVQYGRENHCICSFKYEGKNIDIWKESFKENRPEEIVESFYNKLKKSLELFKSAKTFAQVRENYFSFRTQFFDMNLCSQKTNNILSRCISELGAIIDLEGKYEECIVPCPFDFFVDFLSDVKYLEQAEEGGVQIYPYKTAACAPFSCHFVVDSSQNSLNVAYKELSFLNDEKRTRLLKRDETNVSDKYIWLYLMNSVGEQVQFSCSKRTLDGYSQAVSYLREVDLDKIDDEEKLFPENPYNAEKKWFCGEKIEFPKVITQIQSESFFNWLKIQKTQASPQEKSILALSDITFGNDKNGKQKKLHISATGLKKFYSCPRIYFFEKILNLKKQENAGELIDQYASGNLYHKILECFCKKLLKDRIQLKIEENALSPEFAKMLKISIDEAINSCENGESSYLKKQLLNTTKQTISDVIFKFVTHFCTVFNGCFVEKTEGSFYFSEEGKDYSFMGKIDCLLKDAANEQYYLVDFKNSKYAIPENLFYEIPQNENDEKEIALEEQDLPDFQMPLYVFLLENQEKPIKVENAAFFDISNAVCVPVFGKEIAGRAGKNREEIFNYDDFRATIEKTKQASFNFVNRIKDGDFRLNDKIQTFTKCSACDYRTICRKTFNVAKGE